MNKISYFRSTELHIPWQNLRRLLTLRVKAHRQQDKLEVFRQQHKLQVVRKGEHREVRDQKQEQKLRHPLSYLEQHSGCQVSRMKPSRSISQK